METVDLILLGLTGSRSDLIEALEIFEKQNAALIRRVERLTAALEEIKEVCVEAPSLVVKEIVIAILADEALKEDFDSVGCTVCASKGHHHLCGSDDPNCQRCDCEFDDQT